MSRELVSHTGEEVVAPQPERGDIVAFAGKGKRWKGHFVRRVFLDEDPESGEVVLMDTQGKRSIRAGEEMIFPAPAGLPGMRGGLDPLSHLSQAIKYSKPRT